jgi:predicted transposase/invertase (TIGR01784 family)
LYCQNDKGEKFIVEIQKAKQKYFKDRSVYYATFPIQEQAEKGEWDYELQGVYSIAIMDFVFHDAYHTDFRHDVQLMEVNRKELFYDKLMFLYLEMPKFNKSIDELANHYEKWLFLLKNLSSFDKMPEKFKEKVFKKLFEVAAIANYNESEQQAYQDSLRYYRDWKNVLDNKYEEGKAEGFEEGKAEGFEEGKAEGFEEGKKKGLYNTAKNMKQKGFSITTIIELTGLSEDEIQLL